MSQPKNDLAHNAHEQAPIDGGVGEGNFKSGEEFTIPGSDRSEIRLRFGFLTDIDRDSEVWKNASEGFKGLVEDNDRNVRQRMDLEKSNEGRLELFLKDFQSSRMRFTKNGSIWLIETSCRDCWEQARGLRNSFGLNVLRPLPHLPVDFQNASRVQNALNALEAWAQESIVLSVAAKPSAKPQSHLADPPDELSMSRVSPPPKNSPGAKRKFDPKADDAKQARWESAKGRRTKQEFCQDERITVKAFDQTLARIRTRKNDQIRAK